MAIARFVANRFPVVVDDGEGKELTLFSVRAKMYVMEKGVGWKERGAGMLKVNVPKTTVDLNTIILPAMKFQVTNRLKSSTILFTAFEGGEARQVQMKVCFCRTGQFWLGKSSAKYACTDERGECHGILAPG
jgi:hypothetical protein